MNCVDVSNSIALRFPANKSSLSRRRLIDGAGVNDAPYVVSPMLDGERLWCPAYGVWYDMIKRGFNKKKKARCPAYAEASVCDEWLSFMSFRAWWVRNVVDGWHIDKDLLVMFNKKYSPETCIFVPAWLNLIVQQSTSDGLKGAHFEPSRGKYLCMCSFDIKKQRNLGRFDTAEEAHNVWLNARLNYVESRKDEITAIHPDIYMNVVRLISK